MSADNGIYILETLGKKNGEFEYRIAELQAVENYSYDEVNKCDSADPDIQIKNARKMWGRSPVYYIKSIALITAGKMLEDCLNDEFGICEYGIQLIKIPAKF